VTHALGPFLDLVTSVINENENKETVLACGLPSVAFLTVIIT
jgi:hypothetical protein